MGIICSRCVLRRPHDVSESSGWSKSGIWSVVSIRDTNTVPSRALCRQICVEERCRPRAQRGRVYLAHSVSRCCPCNPRGEEIKESSNKAPNRAGFLGAGGLFWGLSAQESARNAGKAGLIPGQEDPLEKGMATHSRVLAWRIPWTEEPGGLQPRGSQRVGHDGAAKQQEQHEDRNHFPLPAAIEPGPPSSPPCSWHRADAQ